MQYPFWGYPLQRLGLWLGARTQGWWKWLEKLFTTTRCRRVERRERSWFSGWLPGVTLRARTNLWCPLAWWVPSGFILVIVSMTFALIPCNYICCWSSTLHRGTVIMTLGPWHHGTVTMTPWHVGTVTLTTWHRDHETVVTTPWHRDLDTMARWHRDPDNMTPWPWHHCTVNIAPLHRGTMHDAIVECVWQAV